MRKKYIGASGISRKLLLLFVIAISYALFSILDFGKDFTGVIAELMIGSFFIFYAIPEFFLFDIYILDERVFYTNFILKNQIEPQDFISIKKIRFFPFLYKLSLHKQKGILFSCVSFKPLMFSFFEDAVDFSEDYERVIKETFAKNEDF